MGVGWSCCPSQQQQQEEAGCWENSGFQSQPLLQRADRALQVECAPRYTRAERRDGSDTSAYRGVRGLTVFTGAPIAQRSQHRTTMGPSALWPTSVDRTPRRTLSAISSERPRWNKQVLNILLSACDTQFI